MTELRHLVVILPSAHRVIQKLHVGIACIKTCGEGSAARSVGGYKNSGLGPENWNRGPVLAETQDY